MKIQSRNLGRYKRNIVLSIAMDFFSSLFLIKVVYTLFYQQRGIPLLEVGIILGAFQLSKILFEIPTGVVADKYGRKISLIIGSVLFEAYLIMTLLGNSFIIFFISMLLQGIAVTFISGSDSAIFVDSINLSGGKDKLARYGAISQFASYLGMSLGALIGGFLAANGQYDFVYLAQIITFSIPLFITIFLTEPPYEKVAKEKPVSSRIVFDFIYHNKVVLYLILLNSFIAFSFIPIDSYYANFLIMNGINEKITGLILFLQQFIGTVFVIFVLLKRPIKVKKFSNIVMLKFLPLLMMAALFVTFLIKMSIIAFVCYFIAQFIFILINPIIFEELHTNSPSEYRATIGSYFSFFQSIVALVVNLLFGYLSNKLNMSISFMILIIASFALLILNNVILKSSSSNKTISINQQSEENIC